MKKFTPQTIKEANKVADGEEYIFTFTDCGHKFENINVNYEGRQFFKIDSRYNDIDTGAALDTYYCNDYEFESYLIRNMDGTFEYDICY